MLQVSTRRLLFNRSLNFGSNRIHVQKVGRPLVYVKRNLSQNSSLKSADIPSNRGNSSLISRVSLFSFIFFSAYGLFVWHFQEWFCANSILSSRSKELKTEHTSRRRESTALSRILTEPPTSLTIVSGFDSDLLIASTLASNGLTSPCARFHHWESFNMPNIIVNISESFGISSTRYSLYFDKFLRFLAGDKSDIKHDSIKELDCTLRILTDALQLVEAERLAEEAKLSTATLATTTSPSTATPDTIDFSPTWISSFVLSKILPFSDVTLPSIDTKVTRPVIYLNGLFDQIFQSDDNEKDKMELLTRILTWADDVSRIRKMAHVVLNVADNSHLLTLYCKLKKLPSNTFNFPMTLILNKDISLIDSKFFIDGQVAVSIVPQMHPSVYSTGLIVETIGNDLGNLGRMVDLISKHLKNDKLGEVLTEDLLDDWIADDWRQSLTSLWSVLSSLRSDYIPPFVLSQSSAVLKDIEFEGMIHSMQALDCLLRICDDEYVPLDDLILNHLNGNCEVLSLLLHRGLVCLDKTTVASNLQDSAAPDSVSVSDALPIELTLADKSLIGSQISVCFPSKSRRRIMQLLFHCPVQMGDNSSFTSLRDVLKHDIVCWNQINKTDWKPHSDTGIHGLLKSLHGSELKISSFYELINWLEREKQIQREIIIQVLKLVQIPHLSPSCNPESITSRGSIASSVLHSINKCQGHVSPSDIQGIFCALGAFATQQDVSVRLRSSSRQKPDYSTMFDKVDAATRHRIANQN